MPKRIFGALRMGNTVFKEGDEKKLAKAGISAETLARLEKRGVISGFVSKPLAEDMELPKVSELADVLAGIDDVDEVRAMADADDRMTAKAIYDARIAELA